MNSFFHHFLASGFCAFKQSREDLVGQFVEWECGILKPFGASIKRQNLDGFPDQLVGKLFPLVSPVSTKNVFLELGDDWVIALDNGFRGTDAAIAPVLSAKCACLAIRVVSQPHTLTSVNPNGKYGAEIFESYQDGLCVRTIYSANDGGKWKFGSTGSPYPVEDLARYQVKTVRERFRRPDLIRILDYLGCNPFSNSQYDRAATVKGTLITRTGKFPVDYQEKSSNQ